MKKFTSTSRKSGFSLMEALIVVAIIAIMLCIAVPNIIAYSRELTLTALDDSAHSIFMAAQNNLSAMKNSGVSAKSLEALGELRTRDNGVEVIMVAAESDSHDDQDGLHMLLPHGSIDYELHQHQYVVDILPESGIVYAVWYWENGTPIKHEYALTYAASDTDGIDYSDKTFRLKNNIMAGYYGGMDIDRPDLDQTPIPAVELINAEELRLNIYVSGESLSVRNLEPTATITLIGKDGTRVCVTDQAQLRYETGGPSVFGGYVGTVVLDTLDKETPAVHPDTIDFRFDNNDKISARQSFEKWATYDPVSRTYDITPGDNFDIEIRIDVAAIGETETFMPAIVCKHNVNSLFAAKEDDTAFVAYGRHLQNLNNDKSGVTAAQQCGDIRFGEQKDPESYYCWQKTYPSKNFEPIFNDKLEKYLGQCFEISDMSIDRTGESEAGMFVSDCKSLNLLSKIYLIDAQIVGKDYVGALMGKSLQKLNINGCRVWTTDIDKNKYFDGKTVGGLVGDANEELIIENSCASVFMRGDTLGGLVGRLGQGGSITSSYAAGYLDSADLAGGLAGKAIGALTVKKSYSAGIIAKAKTAGGLVADGTASVSGTYSAVRYSSNIVTSVEKDPKSISVYGTFYGDGSTEYISQMGLDFVENSGKPVTSFDLYVSGWMRTKQLLTDEQQQKEKANVHPYKAIPETQHQFGMSSYYPYQKIETEGGYMPHYGDWLEESEAYLVYYEQYGDESFGLYANHERLKVNSLKNAIDGDFDSRNYVIDDGYALFIMSAPETSKPLGLDVTIDGKAKVLQSKALTTPFRGVQADCIMYIIKEPSISIPADWNGYEYDWSSYKPADTGEGVVDADGDHTLNQPIANYYLPLTYTIKYEQQGGDNYGQTYTNPYSVKTYYFNPHFACEVYENKPADYDDPDKISFGAKPGAEGLDEEHRIGDLEILSRSKTNALFAPKKIEATNDWEGTVIIRSARQLSNIHCYTNPGGRGIASVKNAQFHQLMDIDFEKYANAQLLSGGGQNSDRIVPAMSWKGGYDGHECIIRNIYLSREAIADQQGVGLFGKTVGSTLQNIRIVNATAFVGSDDFGDYMGGLVGYAENTTIKNCGIFDEAATDANYKNAIPSQQPIYRHRAINSNDDNIYVGGLIGGAYGCNISESFAAVKVFGFTAGGFIGIVEKGTVITDCYSGGFTQNATIYDGKGYLDGYPAYSEQSGTDTINVGGSEHIGGFVGVVKAGAQFKGICYSTCSVRGAKAGLFAGSFDKSVTYETLYAKGVVIINANPTTYEITLPGFDKFTLSTYGKGTPSGDPAFSDLTDLPCKATASHPYNENLWDKETGKPLAFPYPSNLSEHYGDWVQPKSND